MDLMQPKGTGHAFKLPCWRDAAMHAILLPLETNAKMKAWIVKAAPEPYAPGQPAEGLWGLGLSEDGIAALRHAAARGPATERLLLSASDSGCKRDAPTMPHCLAADKRRRCRLTASGTAILQQGWRS
jgi:hypothetical protein